MACSGLRIWPRDWLPETCPSVASFSRLQQARPVRLAAHPSFFTHPQFQFAVQPCQLSFRRFQVGNITHDSRKETLSIKHDFAHRQMNGNVDPSLRRPTASRPMPIILGIPEVKEFSAVPVVGLVIGSGHQQTNVAPQQFPVLY